MILVFILAGFYHLHALNPGAVTIVNKSGPSFILDDKKPCEDGPLAAYVAYEICNNSSDVLTGLNATLSGLNSGFGLQGGQPAVQAVGTLAPGACKMVFWHVRYPCTSGFSTEIKITVSDANPGAVSFSNKVITIKHKDDKGAGKIKDIEAGPAPSLNALSGFDVTYEFEKIPVNGFLYFQPAGNLGFDAGCMQLTGAEVIASERPDVLPVGSNRSLYYNSPVEADKKFEVTMRYYFKIICLDVETELIPYAAANTNKKTAYSEKYGNETIQVPDDFMVDDCDGNFDDFATLFTDEDLKLESKLNNWSVSWGDYNSDGYPDLFITTYDTLVPNFLYKNEKNGKFKRITKGTLETDVACSLAATWGDYDNDGDLDIFVANNADQQNYLYRNEGNDLFVKIQNSPIVADLGFAHGVSWADYDNDGYLDLFVGTYYETAFNLLFHNNGDGTFDKVLNNPIATEVSRTITGAWGDYNNDGWIDLFVVNRTDANNSLYKNEGNGKFTRITSGDIVNDGGNSVGASWGDYDNDGDLDLFVANAGDQHNFLYQNNGDGTFKRIMDEPVATDGGHSHGSAWADYDNDGDLDLFVANDGQPNFFYQNDGKGHFTRLDNPSIGGGNALSFGTAWADYDRDGDVDLYVSNRANEADFIYRNEEGNCNAWISVRLKGTISNNAGIGAKIFVVTKTNGERKSQMREVSAQSGGGTGGQNDMVATFGLGYAPKVDSIIIKWPSGYTQILAYQAINQHLTITEENGSQVCGTVYNDVNQNCIKDDSEKGIPNIKILLQPGDIVAYTNDDGEYSVFVKPGFYGIQEIPGENWTPICPNKNGTASVNVKEIGQQYCGFNFGNTAICSNPDISVKLATAVSRIGYNNLLIINYANEGAGESSKTELTVDLDPNMIPMVSSIPWKTHTGNQLLWDLSKLDAGTKGSIFLVYQLDKSTDIGSHIKINAAISSKDEDDCVADNNFAQETSLAISALDPNDILVSPEGAIAKDEWLTYKIRFQNVGNSPASWVRVENELPAGLDLTTFETGVVSHTYQFQADGRKLVWTFPNINLPDSLNNEPESHGFITFRIQPRKELRAGDQIINSAVIYFDNLEGIVTNEVVNVIRGENQGNPTSFNTLDVFPNPSTGVLTVQFNNTVQVENPEFQTLRVYDMQGRPVLEKTDATGDRVQLDLQQFPTGNYLVKGMDWAGNQYLGKVILQK